ncbi:MAG: hydroxymethylbilane synthase [Verrucomicrobiae bacterium]|nr:hydroxymethylbilane synthase [Verrucomicrobiae bacterium]
MTDRPIIVATRGSPLALAQTYFVLSLLRTTFPKLRFELKVIKTTGDKLQLAALAQQQTKLPKGLFTKELEVALLNHRADVAVHSLKDLPTDLPPGLKLAAIPKRANANDVIICRSPNRPETDHSCCDRSSPEPRGLQNPLSDLSILPTGATIATSSTRRKAQLLEYRPDLQIIDIRGNVTTRLEKLAESPKIHAIVLAQAGLDRLNFQITPNARLTGDAAPPNLRAFPIPANILIPCVGQGAIGLEIRADDERMDSICARVDHYSSRQCVMAERAFLRAMGGGCQSPVAAYAEVVDEKIHMLAVSYRTGTPRRAEGKRHVSEAVILGEELATALRDDP